MFEIRMPDRVFKQLSGSFLKQPIRSRICSHDAVVVTFDDEEAANDAIVLATAASMPTEKVYRV